MSKNSLTTLIGQYSSDSENEDEPTSNPSANGKDSKSTKSLLPTTHWTQCTDPNTGHPYYWNVETKEVTWEPPPDYENYLYSISSMFKKIPDDCWIRGYSQAVKASYYVNEYTRVVSWERPKNFKEPQKKPSIAKSTEKGTDIQPEKRSALTSAQSNLKKDKNKTKRSLPPHLEHSSDDEKIELITSFSGPDSSSDEDTNRRDQKEIATTISNRNLVAAYATDESDSEVEEVGKNLVKPTDAQEKEVRNVKQVKVQQEIEAGGGQDKTEKNDTEITNTSNTQANSFSNIIVGGVSESTIDEEIMRLKKELEKDLGSFENESEKQEKPSEVNESFDEKTFQRKKRIQFRSSSKRTENSQKGTSFSQILETGKKKEKYNLYKNFQRSHVEFENTKGNESEKPQLACDNDSISDESMKLKGEIDDLSDLILGKVKFLAVGHPDVTAVQAMNIQLETLLAAFRCSALDSAYFFKWLKATSDDLISLEQNACPEGWKCMWDRESSQYCYKNLATGDVQWEFPEERTDEENQGDGIAGGEDEMDISTTPPPNENEQLKIENEVPPWDECNPPPPPIISVQAPPPPPNINCELASFYSDIATIETSSTTKEESNQSLSPTGDEAKKRLADDSNIKKRRKKAKVHGLGLKMKEVSNMVANWKKAQKELDN